MSKHDIDKAYVSPYDKFFFDFDAKHEKTKSQLNEINKYKIIFARRDHAQLQPAEGELWESF